MSTEQERADFEAWYLENNDVPREAIEREGAGYVWIGTDEAWEIWQAALASPKVRALRKDAERFRFLRDNAQLFSHFGDIGNSGWCVMQRDSSVRRVFTYNGQELDEAIDHARRVEGEQE